MCGVFNIGRQVFDEYNVKAQLHFAGGAFEMPTAIDSFSASIVDRIVLGQAREVALPLEPGRFTFEKVRGGGVGVVTYLFDYKQKFALPGGEPVELILSLVDFDTRDGVIVDEVVVLDEAFLTDELSLETRYERNAETISNFYSSCGYELLQLFDIRVELEDGTAVTLEERFRDEVFGDFQPASLVRATVDIAAESAALSPTTGISSTRPRGHNTHVEHMVILDPPVTVPGVAEPVYAVHVIAPLPQDNIEAEAVYRDAQLNEIKRLARELLRSRRSARRPVRPRRCEW